GGEIRGRDEGESERRAAVGLPAADLGRVGVRLPGGERDPLVDGGWGGSAGAIRLVARQRGSALPPGGAAAAEGLGTVRPARQCVGVVPVPLRRPGQRGAGRGGGTGGRVALSADAWWEFPRSPGGHEVEPAQLEPTGKLHRGRWLPAGADAAMRV